MNLSIIFKLGLLGVLIGLQFSLSPFQSTTTDLHPYIPPLTHTPGLGVSMIGSHSPPPHMAIQMLNIPISMEIRTQLDTFYQQQHLLMEQGFAHRMTMQRQVRELLTLLPPGTASISLENRFHNEQRIGELKIWQDLIQTLPAQ